MAMTFYEGLIGGSAQQGQQSLQNLATSTTAGYGYMTTGTTTDYQYGFNQHAPVTREMAHDREAMVEMKKMMQKMLKQQKNAEEGPRCTENIGPATIRKTSIVRRIGPAPLPEKFSDGDAFIAALRNDAQEWLKPALALMH